MIDFGELKFLHKADSLFALERLLKNSPSFLITLNLNLILMEIRQFPNSLNSTPINHNNLTSFLNPIDNSPSHPELATRELIKQDKSPHIDVLTFLDLDEIVERALDVPLIEEGDDLVKDLEIVGDCLAYFCGLVTFE